MLTVSTAIHGNNSSDDVEKESAVPRAALLPAHYFSDNEEDTPRTRDHRFFLRGAVNKQEDHLPLAATATATATLPWMEFS